jgi:hypothetical protein
VTQPQLQERRAFLLTRTGENARESGTRVVHSLVDTLYREIKSEVEVRLEDDAMRESGMTPDYACGMRDALDIVRQACRLVKGHEQL